MTGRLIAIEGIDGAGKTTQVRMLSNWLAERHIRHCVFSLYKNALLQAQLNSLNQRGLIRDHEATLMYAADWAGRIEYVVKPALERGDIVLCDKYLLGGRVRDRCYGVTEVILDAVYSPLPAADAQILLTLDPAEAARRKGAGAGFTIWECGLLTFCKEPVAEIQAKVGRGEISKGQLAEYFRRFQSCVQDEYRRLLADAEYVEVDAAQPEDAIAAKLRTVLEE